MSQKKKTKKTPHIYRRLSVMEELWCFILWYFYQSTVRHFIKTSAYRKGDVTFNTQEKNLPLANENLYYLQTPNLLLDSVKTAKKFSSAKLIPITSSFYECIVLEINKRHLQLSSLTESLLGLGQLCSFSCQYKK